MKAKPIKFDYKRLDYSSFDCPEVFAVIVDLDNYTRDFVCKTNNKDKAEKIVEALNKSIDKKKDFGLLGSFLGEHEINHLIEAWKLYSSISRNITDIEAAALELKLEKNLGLDFNIPLI